MLRTEALRVFVTVADCGNIRDAAERLFRTQSAVSMSLKQIEDHLGAPLFETDRKHSLTELGDFVAGVARVLLRDHDRAIELIEQRASGKAGRLRIASVPSFAALVLPAVLGDFLAQRPQVEIDLVDTDSADVRRLVAGGQADLGIASLPSAEPGLQVTPILEDGMFVVCRADSDLAQRTGVLDWADLAGRPFILNEATRGISSPEFLAIAAQAGLRVRNVTSLLAMVAEGIGVTLLPGLATAGLVGALVARPLRDETCRRQMCLVRRVGQVPGPLVSAFENALMAALATMARAHGMSVLQAGQRKDFPH